MHHDRHVRTDVISDQDRPFVFASVRSTLTRVCVGVRVGAEMSGNVDKQLKSKKRKLQEALEAVVEKQGVCASSSLGVDCLKLMTNSLLLFFCGFVMFSHFNASGT